MSVFLRTDGGFVSRNVLFTGYDGNNALVI